MMLLPPPHAAITIVTITLGGNAVLAITNPAIMPIPNPDAAEYAHAFE